MGQDVLLVRSVYGTYTHLEKRKVRSMDTARPGITKKLFLAISKKLTGPAEGMIRAPYCIINPRFQKMRTAHTPKSNFLPILFSSHFSATARPKASTSVIFTNIRWPKLWPALQPLMEETNPTWQR